MELLKIYSLKISNKAAAYSDTLVYFLSGKEEQERYVTTCVGYLLAKNAELFKCADKQQTFDKDGCKFAANWPVAEKFSSTLEYFMENFGAPKVRAQLLEHAEIFYSSRKALFNYEEKFNLSDITNPVYLLGKASINELEWLDNEMQNSELSNMVKQFKIADRGIYIGEVEISD